MTLQLANRSRDYYLYEIDKVKDNVTELTSTSSILTNMVTTMDIKVDEIDENTVGIIDSFKVNPGQQKIEHKNFNDDVICYYDFSNPSMLAQDKSGNGHHGKNESGVTHSDERTHSVKVVRHAHATHSNSYNNVNTLNLDAVANSVHLATYTISFWYKKAAAADHGTILSFCNTAPVGDTYFGFFATPAGDLLMLERKNDAIVFNETINLNEAIWNHVVFTNSALGHRVYINNVETTGTFAYGTTKLTSVKLNAIAPNRVTIGAVPENVNTQVGLGEKYKYGYSGSVSDVIVFNRIITAAEIELMSTDNYGSDIIVLAGQSNMEGHGVLEVGIDDDYTLHDNRVYQYDTKANVTSVEPIAYTGTYNIPPATNSLQSPFPKANSTGLWKTFIDDYVRYSNTPFRKSIIVVPVASGGTTLEEHWNQTGYCYKIAQKAINHMTHEDHNTAGDSQFYKIKCFLWVHGESDALNQNLEYKAQFMSMYDGFKSSVAGFDASVPVILTELAVDFDAVNTTTTPPTHMKQFINDVFTSLVEENDNFSIIKTVGLLCNADAKHFSAPALRTMGHRMFDEYMKVIKQSSIKPTTSVDMISTQARTDLYLKPIQTLGWTNEPLTHYGRKAFTYTLHRAIGTGGNATLSVTIDYVRLGSMMMVTFRDITTFTVGSTNTHYLTVNNSIPADLMPTEDTMILNVVTQGDNLLSGYWYFNPSVGTLELKQHATNDGLFDATLEYSVSPSSGCFITKNIHL